MSETMRGRAEELLMRHDVDMELCSNASDGLLADLVRLLNSVREETVDQIARSFETQNRCHECGDGTKMLPAVSVWRCSDLPSDHTATGPAIGSEIREAAKRTATSASETKSGARRETR